MAEATKAAEATGATNAGPAKPAAQSASVLPEEKHNPLQQVTQLAAGVMKAAGCKEQATAKAAGMEAARVALQVGATGADALQHEAFAVNAARGTPEDVVKAADAAASKLATVKHGEVAAPHIIAQTISNAVASEARDGGGRGTRTLQHLAVQSPDTPGLERGSGRPDRWAVRRVQSRLPDCGRDRKDQAAGVARAPQHRAGVAPATAGEEAETCGGRAGYVEAPAQGASPMVNQGRGTRGGSLRRKIAQEYCTHPSSFRKGSCV